MMSSVISENVVEVSDTSGQQLRGLGLNSYQCCGPRFLLEP